MADLGQCEADDLEGEGQGCWEPAPFLVNRIADSDLWMCPKHLGYILRDGDNVLWPPVIEWLGEGPKPPNSIMQGAEAEERTAEFLRWIYE